MKLCHLYDMFDNETERKKNISLIIYRKRSMKIKRLSPKIIYCLLHLSSHATIPATIVVQIATVTIPMI